ncbi:NBAS subunit of NRZ tethering complex-like isoform X2 [Dysidea avara]|uniref:NBAS subunit of NRZ tethering complex-like isoform X2 n=1 Tax=Dysidea avara TaxID=196820 RepID=UPI00333179B8
MEQSEDSSTILYDILEPFEWPTHTEIIPGEMPSSLWKSLATTAKGCAQYSMQKIVSTFRSACPPSSVCRLLADTIPWKIALSSDGNMLAVLGDSHVELRCLDDDFVIAIAKCAVTVDAHPQWRKIVWSDDNSCLAVANSSGEVRVFSQNGIQLCHIGDDKAVEENDLSQAVAGICFIPIITHHTSNLLARFIVTSVSGQLSCYAIRSAGQCSLLHMFSFLSHHPYGVGSVLYQPQHQIIIVAATGIKGVCVSKWRMLDSAPHYAIVEGRDVVQKTSSFLPYQQSSSDKAWVFRMELSPSGSTLATIDVVGKLSLYDVPSLKLRKSWSIEEQKAALQDGEGMDDIPTNKKDELPHPLDISWWSDQALIIVNSQGSLTVSSTTSLDNLLGASAESCQALTCLTSAHDGSFLFLECEQSTASMTTPLQSITNSANLSESEEEVSSTKRVFKHLLYSLTEMERFQPPRKKPRVISRTYRIVCLKSTTPQELYRRKIDSEEYGYALQLAKTYQLDCDLVYQQQWNKSPISKATIEDYLSRVSKQQWVMSECLRRVTNNYEAMIDLLKYGLIRTSIEKVAELASEETGVVLTKLLRSSKVKSLKFNDNQMFLVMCRVKLLSYLDRLSLIQEILGGPVATDENFSGDDFLVFRDQNVVELALNYAQQGNWKAVGLLFTYHGNQTLPHRLTILSNFPETLPPEEYMSLLPEVTETGVLEPWQQESWRETCDWCELEVCRELLQLEEESNVSGDFLYEHLPHLAKYRSASTHDIISSWYHERAREIEQLSGEALNSLKLVEIAKDFGVKDTTALHNDLLTLKCIVFEHEVDTRLTLASLEKMSALEKLVLLTKKVDPKEFAGCFEKFASPFLQRQENVSPGSSEKLLAEYLGNLAKDDLQPCLTIIKTAHTEHPASPLLKNTIKLIELILRCLYTCERTDQLDIADKMFECIPEEKKGDPPALVKLHRQVDALDNHLQAADLLHQYGVKKPVYFIRDNKNNNEEAKKIMIKIARTAAAKKPPLKDSDWLSLSKQLLELQENTFTCLSQDTCYQVLAESLLSSGVQHTIMLGSQLLAHNSYQVPIHVKSSASEQKSGATFKCKIPFSVSVKLVLSAAQDYFNSASSPSDHEMDLAQQCLDLIGETVSEITAEKELIEAMRLLASCQVSILPVKVRLCVNKLEIIDLVLKSNPALCKSSDKILQIAKLLGLKNAKVGGANRSALTGDLGQAAILIVQAAITHSEYPEAYQLCHELMSAPCPAAWSVCSNLGTQDKFEDLPARMELLQFTLTHCPPGEMKRLLQALRGVEAEQLYQHCTVDNTTSSSSGGGRMVQLVSYGSSTVQQLVTKGAGAVHQLIRPSTSDDSIDGGRVASYLGWMSSAASGLQSYWRATPATPISPGHAQERAQLTQSCHPFYDDRLTAVSDDYTVLKPVSISDTYQLNQAVLRTSLLLGDCSQPTGDVIEVLLRMAESCATTNLPLLLAYLLTLPDPMLAKHLILKLEPNVLNLHVAIYYICLQLCVLVRNWDSSLYLQPPATVVTYVASWMTTYNPSDWPEKVQELVEFLKELSVQLGDLAQGKILQELGLGIDVDKFTQDATYKHQTILMLARSSDNTFISTGLRLAARYDVPKWEVYMEHLDWLFTDNKLAHQVMLNHVTQLGIYEVAVDRPQQTVNYLTTTVFPKMRGTDHTSLLVYLDLVKRCVQAGASDIQPVDVSTQIKLLEKFKTSLQTVDFKAVVSGDDPLLALQPHLTSDNVHVVAKVANKIPLSKGGHLQPSNVFCTFAERLFWNKKQKVGKTMSKATDWLHQYELCQDYLKRLTATEYETIIKSFTLSPTAIQLIPSDDRTKIVRKCIVFITSQSCKMEGADKLVVKLQQLLSHLKVIEKPELVSLAKMEECKLFYEEFAMTICETDKVHSLLLRMLVAGLDQQLASSMISLSHSVVPHTLLLSDLITEALTTSLTQLNSEDMNEEALSAIGNILRSCQKNPASSMDLVMDVLSDFYRNSSHPPDARISVLRLIEQTSALRPADIVQYKTEAILCNQFDIKVDHSQMESDEDHQSLITQLLSQAGTVEQLMTLVKLLQSWPDPITSHIASWGHLLVQLALQPHGRGYVLHVRAGLEGLPPDIDKQLYENLSGDLLTAFKIAIISRHDGLLNTAMEDAKSLFNELASDHTVLELLIQCRQVHMIVNTPLYQPLLQYLSLHSQHELSLTLFSSLLHCPQEEVCRLLQLHDVASRVNFVSQQLYHHGYWMEAGAILLRSHGTHPALVTTGNALSVIHKMFKS